MAKPDLKKENAKLKSRIKMLEDQLAGYEAPPQEAWEAQLKQIVKSNPEQTEKMLAQRFGLSPDYKSENLFEHAHARARANGPAKFIEELQNSINDPKN